MNSFPAHITGRYSVVVLDIDGTITGRDLGISPRLMQAVAGARDAGAIVSLATGRMMRSARRFSALLGADGPAISYQGALTFDPASGEVLRHERLDAPTARTAIQALEAQGAHVNVYIDDEVYVAASDPWADGYATRMQVELRTVPDLAAIAAQSPTLVLGVDEERGAGHLADHMSGLLDGTALVTHSLRHFCEVGSVRAGKEQALAHLSGLLGIPPEAFVAFGDGRGDVGMLRWAGLGVAMGSGHSAARAAADFVAPTLAEDGVAQVLEAMLDRGLLGR